MWPARALFLALESFQNNKTSVLYKIDLTDIMQKLNYENTWLVDMLKTSVHIRSVKLTIDETTQYLGSF